MKNTRRGGPGGCAFAIGKGGFSGRVPEAEHAEPSPFCPNGAFRKGNRRSDRGEATVVPAVVSGKTGTFNRTNITKKLRFLQKISKNRNFFGPSGGI